MLKRSHKKLTLTTYVKKFHALQKADGFHLEIRKIINPKQPLPQKNKSNIFQFRKQP